MIKRRVDAAQRSCFWGVNFLFVGRFLRVTQPRTIFGGPRRTDR